MNDQLYGGVEAGGTKFICAIGNKAGEIIAQTKIVSRGPDETLDEVAKFFENGPKINSLGIGCFGPINLDNSSENFGQITNAPKHGWESINIKSVLEEKLHVPAMIDTDVSVAALGERFFGLAQQTDNFVYITIGTGIGGSLMVDGKLYHGASHVELGHMRIPLEPLTESVSTCVLHEDCLDGIASGKAMGQRWGQRAEDITNPEAWDLEAKYLAKGIANLIMVLRPKLFILGGGVMKHDGLLESIHRYARQNVNGYLELPALGSYIIRSNNPANGVLGAIQLAPI